jgi:hypothetical protein
MNDPFRSPVLRLAMAYLIGVNVFGLVSVLSFVLASRFGQASPVGLIGLFGGIACGLAAGWRVTRMMKTAGLKAGPKATPNRE